MKDAKTDSRDGEPGEVTGTTDDGAYLEGVMAEIEDEVRRRRVSGDLPVRIERELDELFLEFSPVAGRGGSLTEALDADPELAEAFQALTPGRRKSYLFNLNQAKHPATRAARIEKFRERIIAGKGAMER